MRHTHSARIVSGTALVALTLTLTGLGSPAWAEAPEDVSAPAIESLEADSAEDTIPDPDPAQIPDPASSDVPVPAPGPAPEPDDAAAPTPAPSPAPAADPLEAPRPEPSASPAEHPISLSYESISPDELDGWYAGPMRAEIHAVTTAEDPIEYTFVNVGYGIVRYTGANATVELDSEGEHLLQAYAQDTAGVISGTFERRIRIDMTAPEITSDLAPGRTFTVGQRITVTPSCSDALSGVRACPEPQQLDTSVAGGFDLYVVARDVAGNRRALVVPYTVVAEPGEPGGGDNPGDVPGDGDGPGGGDDRGDSDDPRNSDAPDKPERSDPEPGDTQPLADAPRLASTGSADPFALGLGGTALAAAGALLLRRRVRTKH